MRLCCVTCYSFMPPSKLSMITLVQEAGVSTNTVSLALRDDAQTSVPVQRWIMLWQNDWVTRRT